MRVSDHSAFALRHPLIAVAAVLGAIWGLLMVVSLLVFPVRNIDTSWLPPAMTRDFAARRLHHLCFLPMHEPTTIVLAASSGRVFHPDELEKLAPEATYHVIQLSGTNIWELGNVVEYLSTCMPGDSGEKLTYVILNNRYLYAELSPELRPHVRPILTMGYLREKTGDMHAAFAFLPARIEPVFFRMGFVLTYPRFLADYTREAVKRRYRQARFFLSRYLRGEPMRDMAALPGIGLDRQPNFGLGQLPQLLRIRDLTRATGSGLVVVDMPFSPAYEAENQLVASWRRKVAGYLRDNDICYIASTMPIPDTHYAADRLHPALASQSFWTHWLINMLNQGDPTSCRKAKS